MVYDIEDMPDTMFVEALRTAVNPMEEQLLRRLCLEAAKRLAHIGIVDTALAKAAEILANFQDEGERDKLDEWQACYAMLFKQMNDLIQSPKQEAIAPLPEEFDPIAYAERVKQWVDSPAGKAKLEAISKDIKQQQRLNYLAMQLRPEILLKTVDDFSKISLSEIGKQPCVVDGVRYIAVEIYDTEIRYDGVVIWTGGARYKTEAEINEIVENYKQSLKGE